MAKFILDGQEYGGGSSGSNIVKLTQAEYDALSNDKLSNDTIYLITDSGELAAENLFYDGSVTGLGNNVQSAIDELNSNSHKLIDYSNETAIEAGKEFIAPSDGFVMHGVRGGDSTNENFSVKQKFTLNGNVVPPTDSALGTCNGMWAPVKKGDVILIEKNTSVNGTVYTTYRSFYPLRQ